MRFELIVPWRVRRPHSEARLVDVYRVAKPFIRLAGGDELDGTQGATVPDIETNPLKL